MEASDWPSYDDEIMLNDEQVQANITLANRSMCKNEYCVSDEEYIDLIEDYIFPTPYEWILISMHITVFVVGLIVFVFWLGLILQETKCRQPALCKNRDTCLIQMEYCFWQKCDIGSKVTFVNAPVAFYIFVTTVKTYIRRIPVTLFLSKQVLKIAIQMRVDKICLFKLIVDMGRTLGNSLVCVSVYRNHSMRTVTNYFIVNLALADFLVILICLPPSVLWDVTETWFFGSVMCKLVLYLQSVSVSVSVLTLTFISVDRWYAICYPLRFKSTAARAKKAILFIWIVSFLIMLPDAVVLNTRPNPNIKVETNYLTDCAYTWSDEDTRLYQLFIVLLLYVAPFVFMLVAYCQIVRVLWDKNIPGASETTQRLSFKNSTVKAAGRGAAVRFSMPNAACEGQIRSRRKAAKMLIAVVVIFALCYLPVHLINTLRYTMGVPQTHGTTVASLISHWLCYANSAINPVIYNFMNGKFRREFRNAFCILCSGDKPGHRKGTFPVNSVKRH